MKATVSFPALPKAPSPWRMDGPSGINRVWRRCAGQALIEALLGLGLLVVLFWAISVLGRQLDLVQQLAHASRHAVFLQAAGEWDEALEQSLLADFWLAGHEQRWRTSQAQSLIVPGSARWQSGRSSLPGTAEIGGTQQDAAQLRPEWGLQDAGVYQRQAQVSLRGFRAWAPGVESDSASVMMPALVLQRQTSLVAGAGATAGDEESTERLERGPSAWARAAERSRDLGRAATRLLSPLEQGWGRPRPRWDWVRSWQHERPALTVTESGGAGGW